jgi:predicted  nucleic acid-binding Zn-ribbon protein
MAYNKLKAEKQTAEQEEQDKINQVAKQLKSLKKAQKEKEAARKKTQEPEKALKEAQQNEQPAVINQQAGQPHRSIFTRLGPEESCNVRTANYQHSRLPQP